MEKNIAVDRQADLKNENQIKDECYYFSLDRLRLFLMFFACIRCYGFVGKYGAFVQVLSGVSWIAYFIISGYLVMRDEEGRSERLLRTIKRTAIAFVLMTLAYFFIGLSYSSIIGKEIFDTMLTWKFWVKFIVFNVWPFKTGIAIWYVQSLLYGYIVLYFVDKLKLMKFDWIIMIVCLLLSMITGEFSGILNFSILSFRGCEQNFVTLALPYLIAGSIIHRNMSKINDINPFIFLFIGIMGIAISVFELTMLAKLNKLRYYYNLIGMGMMALAICTYAFTNPEDGFRSIIFQKYSLMYAKVIYYIFNIIAMALAIALTAIDPMLFSMTSGVIGIATFFISLLIAMLCSLIRYLIDPNEDILI